MKQQDKGQNPTMNLNFYQIYELGAAIPLKLEIKSLDDKLKFTFFKYSAKDVLMSSLVTFVFFLVLGTILGQLSHFFYTSLIFLGMISALMLSLYPFNIYYTHQMMEYSEEMLRAVLHLSTYTQMGVSMESAFLETEKNLTGILKKQFEDINNSLKRRVVSELGSALKKYVDIWNKANPYFVKSIRLLQIASFSSEKEREILIAETIETLMVNYSTMGKRAAEDLSKNANMLITGGILMPVLSLLVLPIMAVFMPQVVKPSTIAFLYIVFFPTIVLVAALSFASKRIQIDTIRLRESSEYKPLKKAYLYICIGMAVVIGIPTLITMNAVITKAMPNIDSLFYFFLAWLGGAGMAIASYIYATIYVKKYDALWEKIRDVEMDLPFILQSFSTYFALNTPFEKVIDGVIDDYETLGFKDHPAIKGFKGIKHLLITSKDTLVTIIKTQIKKLIPSSKVCTVIEQIVTFETVSQESAAKAARTIRRQVIDTYKLDDYVKTLLADTVGLISVSITFLAPMLCAAAVVMTFAILKSIVFITEQLTKISALFGGETVELNLIDASKVVPPTFIAAVVGVYLLEMIFVLSLFQTQISIGSDFFQTMKNLKSNMIGFFIYSVLLFGGYIAVNIVLFKGVLGAG
ncbi:MAG: hypothetical protein V1866_04505 [archaeon]